MNRMVFSSGLFLVGTVWYLAWNGSIPTAWEISNYDYLLATAICFWIGGLVMFFQGWNRWRKSP